MENENVTQQQTTTKEQQSTPQPNITVTDKGNGSMTAEVNPVSMDDVADETQQTTTTEEQNNSTVAEVEADIQKQAQADTEVKEELEAKGVDFNALADEYDKNGELSAASLKTLEDAGYPKALVDAYLNGLQATTERFVAQVQSMAGGEEAFKNLQTYIKSQPQSVINAFNASIQSGNLGQIQLAISGLQAQMIKTYGTANPTIMSGQTGNVSTVGYTNTADMTKDMRDPRYQVDPVFTREVIRKVKNATFF